MDLDAALDVDAATMRGLMDGFPTVDLPLETITLNSLAIVAGILLAGVVAAFAVVARNHRIRSRMVAKTMRFPRHGLPKEPARRPWWRRKRFEPLTDIRTSIFAEELAALGIADSDAEKRARQDGPHALPLQSPWSWQ